VSQLTQLAEARQEALDRVATAAAGEVVRTWSAANPNDLDTEWDYRSRRIVSTVSNAQIEAARQATPYVGAATEGAAGAAIVHEAFGGVTREGRDVGAEMFSGVTYTKSLIGKGMGVGQAFRAGTALMALLAANTIRDAGRSADHTDAVSKGYLYSVRVVQPSACSRCAILAGVKGYKTDFQRHPSCRCTSMPLRDRDTPNGFFRSPADYFDSLSEAEQNRVFTKSGAWAIRNGADPINVVNARRGAYTTAKRHPDGTFSPSRLKPITIGRRADGSPLQVYATTEGTTSRGAFGRSQALNSNINAGDRYRRTSTLRLMPETVMRMAQDAEHARKLLQRYGYLY
jgi:hypothetical protein